MRRSTKDILLPDRPLDLRGGVLTDPPLLPQGPRERLRRWRPARTTIVEIEREETNRYRVVLRCSIDDDTD